MSLVTLEAISELNAESTVLTYVLLLSLYFMPLFQWTLICDLLIVGAFVDCY